MEPKQLYLKHRNKHREAAKMRRQRSRSRKKLKMEKSSLSDAKFKTLAIWMLKELSEEPSSIKMIHSEMDTVI